MAKKVFIFGAGASHSAGPPLMNGLLDAAHDLMRNSPKEVATEAFSLAFDVLERRLPMLHARSIVDLNDVEAVFNVVEMARLVGRLPGTKPADIAEIGDAIRRLLADTIESNCRFPVLEGQHQPTEDYGRLAAGLAEPRSEFLGDSVAFLTFNYDTAFDFALYRQGLWADYALDDTASHRRGGIPLLKLHGSLNWTLCPKCRCPLVLDFDYFLGQLPSPSAKFKDVPLRLSKYLSMLGSHCEGAAAPETPAIVPPSWNKTQYHETFSRVWGRAAAELSEAEEVYIIGYSFPATDPFFRELLALGLAGGARIRLFAVVDPDEKVADRIEKLLGPDVQGRFLRFGTTFGDFLSRSLKPPPNR